ncbi:MAG: glucose-1-phosphate cytidylyltransferase [Hydrogenophilus sp.]|nr:glucose-1-phosphate cytidylyltransferase [Hydrogenophilus sp.]
MKAVILAGGFGTRLSEETIIKPKPMVEIGGRPILWHILKYYAAFGIHDFIILLGYKGFLIKEYFAHYLLHHSDVTFHMAENRMEIHTRRAEPWRVTLVDTGEATQTAGRLRRAIRYLENEPFFAVTYGDGLSNLDIAAEIAFHRAHGKIATVAAVFPPARFGAIVLGEPLTAAPSLSAAVSSPTPSSHLDAARYPLTQDAPLPPPRRVRSFIEKPAGDGGRINGGFFLFTPEIFRWIPSDGATLEGDVLPPLAEAGELVAFLHDGFWHPMDTLRDKNHLEALWTTGRAPWKIWSDA